MLSLLPLITQVLSLIGMVQGFISSNPALVGGVITTLQQLIPIAMKEGPDAIAAVQAVIASLQGQGNLSALEMNALASLDAQCDAAFDAAAGASSSV